MQKLIILIILIASIISAYVVHTVIKKNIDPKRSVGYLALYVILHLAAVFLLVFITSFLIFQSSSLLFKK